MSSDAKTVRRKKSTSKKSTSKRDVAVGFSGLPKTKKKKKANGSTKGAKDKRIS